MTNVSRWRPALKPAVSPGAGVEVEHEQPSGPGDPRASRSSGTSRCGITEVNHEPGPSTTQSALRMAATDSG